MPFTGRNVYNPEVHKVDKEATGVNCDN